MSNWPVLEYLSGTLDMKKRRPKRQKRMGQEQGYVLGGNPYSGSQIKYSKIVGIMHRSPNEMNKMAFGVGLKKVVLTVTTMQHIVSTIRIEMKMYRQTIRQPQEYLNDMKGQFVPRIKFTMPQQSREETMRDTLGSFECIRWQLTEQPKQNIAVSKKAIRGHLLTISAFLNPGCSVTAFSPLKYLSASATNNSNSFFQDSKKPKPTGRSYKRLDTASDVSVIVYCMLVYCSQSLAQTNSIRLKATKNPMRCVHILTVSLCIWKSDLKMSLQFVYPMRYPL